MGTSNQNQNYESGNVNTGTAESAISAYRLVKEGTSPGQILPCTAITDIAIGVALSTVASGERVDYQTRGVARIECSAGVTRGAQVMPTATGAGKCSTAAGATARSAGQALETSANDGEVISVRINLPNLNGPANS